MYEVINEELGIKACGLADLTAEDLSYFLKQWEDGAKIGSLILFYDEKTGDIFLNKDNKMYESYLELTEEYLRASAAVRREVKEKYSGSAKEVLDVLDNCINARGVEKEIFRARKNHITSDDSRTVLNAIIDRYNIASAVCIAFRYGVMQGKRMERTKEITND